jgi:hypothetical protein
MSKSGEGEGTKWFDNAERRQAELSLKPVGVQLSAAFGVASAGAQQPDRTLLCQDVKPPLAGIVQRVMATRHH